MKDIINLVQTLKAALGENDEIDSDMEDYRNKDCLSLWGTGIREIKSALSLWRTGQG